MVDQKEIELICTKNKKKKQLLPEPIRLYYSVCLSECVFLVHFCHCHRHCALLQRLLLLLLYLSLSLALFAALFGYNFNFIARCCWFFAVFIMIHTHAH